VYLIQQGNIKMPQPPKRTYKSDLRATQAEATRQAIIDAAARLCRTGGWSSVTFPAIAKEAGVSRETVYAVFGNKAALIGEVVKASVARAAPGRHFLDEERPRSIKGQSDPLVQIDLWASYLTEILERVAPLIQVVRTGAEAEPEMQVLYKALHDGRRGNLRLIAESIAQQTRFRHALTVDGAADVLWQLASPEVFSLLTGVGGYTTDAYQKWLAEMLKATLLER